MKIKNVNIFVLDISSLYWNTAENKTYNKNKI